MYHVDEQELLKLDAECIAAAEQYQKYVFAEQIYRIMYERYLAEVKNLIRKEFPEKVSEKELERHVLASPEWKNHHDSAVRYLIKAGKAKIKYKQAVQSFEAMRSALSARKTEAGRGI